ncbi:hypothetical protein HDV02_005587 [Globomyces sp. JEL0801]|nr:hypothetical protein HDV02_005587 [Globomyces sp. JEL0801]
MKNNTILLTDIIPNHLIEDGCEDDKQIYNVAAQIALYLRTQIKEQIGLTTSAGIATSKLWSKLMANEHKPNSQTTIIKPSQSRLDKYPIKSIPGFGSKTISILQNKWKLLSLHNDSRLDGEGMVGQDDFFGLSEDDQLLKMQCFLPPEAHVENKEDAVLLVGDVRSKLPSENSWRSLFGMNSSRLFELVNGIDKAEVKATPPPKQISVEDSFRKCFATDSTAIDVLSKLCSHLLKRFDSEEHSRERMPKRCRIAYRSGWSMIVKSALLPLECIDSTFSDSARTETLRDSLLTLVPKDKQIGFYNVCLYDFQSPSSSLNPTKDIRPKKQKSIANFFEKSKRLKNK